MDLFFPNYAAPIWVLGRKTKMLFVFLYCLGCVLCVSFVCYFFAMGKCLDVELLVIFPDLKSNMVFS